MEKKKKKNKYRILEKRAKSYIAYMPQKRFLCFWFNMRATWCEQIESAMKSINEDKKDNITVVWEG